ncbi:hypothetical protein KGF54_004057 [Candida jiufengensis]|uniref:uncharacterized protein n=1 Tax=Candida jiufengensis TaxID=497108 RepID=UPI0022252BF2|nr:uncharacterized protein KGF54_004057 [Candida jiufengensis]KAI5950983.1 hypothetical protein KGF54_004057 [Candida jiufengensis]
MSSPKDHILKITPPINLNDEDAIKSLNIIKLTVMSKHSPILFKLKKVLIAVNLIGLVTLLVSYKVLFYRIGQLIINLAIILVVLIVLLVSIQEPSDSLTIMRGVGAQLDSKKLLPIRNSNTFISINNMIDVVIHEGFHNYGQVIFYLCFLTKSSISSPNGNSSNYDNDNFNNNEIIKVVFNEFLPRKDILLIVRKLSRQILFNETKRYCETDYSIDS